MDRNCSRRRVSFPRRGRVHVISRRCLEGFLQRSISNGIDSKAAFCICSNEFLLRQKPEDLFRLWWISSLLKRSLRRLPEWKGCVGEFAHRCRKIDLLSIAGSFARWPCGGYLSFDLVNARPGHQPCQKQYLRCIPQQQFALWWNSIRHGKPL